MLPGPTPGFQPRQTPAGVAVARPCTRSQPRARPLGVADGPAAYPGCPGPHAPTLRPWDPATRGSRPAQSRAFRAHGSPAASRASRQAPARLRPTGVMARRPAGCPAGRAL